MYTQAEAQKVLKNPMTQQLVNWIDSQKNITKVLMSPQFFHKTYSKRDKEVICLMLKNFYPGITINRVGDNSVTIIF